MNASSRRKIVLFVCGGDSRRSPMAKVILEQLLDGYRLGRQFEVEGAACKQPDRKSAHPYARQVIKERYGEDLLEGYAPKKMTQTIEDKADVIMVMEEYMKADLPASKPVIVLGIPDPLETIEKFRACAAEIERGIQKNWAKIVGETPSPQKAVATSPQVPPPDPAEFSKGVKQLLQKYGPGAQVDWVYSEIIKIAEGVDFGRGEHAKSVTRLMLNMYDDLVSVGLIAGSPEKRKLAKAVGLSHDIGVSKSEHDHNKIGFQMLKEELWNKGLTPTQKNPLAIVMYGVFYHRNKIPDGKIKPLIDIPLEDYRATAELLSLIRVADGLDYGLTQGSPDKIEKVEMVRIPNGVECRVFPRPGKNVTDLLAKSYEKREVFEATFGSLTFWLPGGSGSWMPRHL